MGNIKLAYKILILFCFGLLAFNEPNNSELNKFMGKWHLKRNSIFLKKNTIPEKYPLKDSILINVNSIEIGRKRYNKVVYEIEQKTLFEYVSGSTTHLKNPFKLSWKSNITILNVKVPNDKTKNPNLPNYQYVITIIKFQNNHVFLDEGDSFVEIIKDVCTH